MKAFFLDTNVFLQCKDLDQLPWADISSGDDVLLLIPSAVQEEIDKLKHDGKSRRATRARKATSLFREIINATDLKKTVKPSAPKVELTFSPSFNAERKMNFMLDLTRNDDRVINEALAYAEDHQETEIALLTDDTNPLLTARRCGLSGVVVPDNWLLPPEPDRRDKKIAELEQRVRDMEKTYPHIDISVEDADENELTSIVIEVNRYAALKDEKVEELMEKVRAFHPLETKDDILKEAANWKAMMAASAGYGIVYTYEPPSEYEITECYDEKYPKWLEEVRNFIKRAHALFEKPSRQKAVVFLIANSGRTPAENAIVEFNCKGGLLFAPPNRDNKVKDEAHPVILPQPPESPHGTYRPIKTLAEQVMEQSRSWQAIEQQQFQNAIMSTPNFYKDLSGKRDRDAFYWRSKPYKNVTEFSFECEEFRHQEDHETFETTIIVPHNESIEEGIV